MTAGQGIEQRLAQGVVLGAEGYVFELERRGYIKAGPYVPEVVLDFPDAVRELHREFLRAGADVMVALTYYAHREKLRHVGRENDLEAMNRHAVRLAREAAQQGGALVAGNVCNTWAYDPADPPTSATVRAQYTEQLGWAVDEGVDFVISETNDYLGEALIALEVTQELGLPAMVTLASTQPDTTRDGYDYVEACRNCIPSSAARAPRPRRTSWRPGTWRAEPAGLVWLLVRPSGLPLPLRLAFLGGEFGFGHCDGDAEGAQDVPSGRHYPRSAHDRGYGDHDPLDVLGGQAAFLDGGGAGEVGDRRRVHRDHGGQPGEHVVARRQGIVPN